MTELPLRGQRIALRYRDGSGPRELIGYVRSSGPEGLGMLDRALRPRLLAWEVLESWRAVPQVPRGRNPVAADRALLDRMAGDERLAGDESRTGQERPSGQERPAGEERPMPTDTPVPPSDAQDLCQVARLGDLLGPAVPEQGPEAYDRGDGLAEHRGDDLAVRAIAVGEWATIRVDGAGAGPDEVLAAVLPLARWAAYRDARNVQVRGTGVELAGFTELRRT